MEADTPYIVNGITPGDIVPQPLEEITDAATNQADSSEDDSPPAYEHELGEAGA